MIFTNDVSVKNVWHLNLIFLWLKGNSYYLREILHISEIGEYSHRYLWRCSFVQGTSLVLHLKNFLAECILASKIHNSFWHERLPYILTLTSHTSLLFFFHHEMNFNILWTSTSGLGNSIVLLPKTFTIMQCLTTCANIAI